MNGNRRRFSLTVLITLFMMLSLAFSLYTTPREMSSGAASLSTTIHSKVLSLNEAKKCITSSETNQRIALINPIFTSTPYSQYPDGSFYAFYHKYAHSSVTNITTDLSWLSTSVSSGLNYGGGWGLSYGLFVFMNSQEARSCGLVIGKNVEILSDIDVNNGLLFNANGTSRFSVVIAGFSEYVTLNEYNSYRNFVATGGRLILVGSDNFQVQVKYDPSSNTETFVAGHGFAFDGKSAWHGVPNRWPADDINWVGSTLCCFHRFKYEGALVNRNNWIGASLGKIFGDRVFFSYTTHEENAIRNLTGTSIIATFANESGTLVASYVHRYQNGTVVCFCAFGDDIISSDPSVQGFLLLATNSFAMARNVTTGSSMIWAKKIMKFERVPTSMIPLQTRLSPLRGTLYDGLMVEVKQSSVLLFLMCGPRSNVSEWYDHSFRR